MFYRVHRSDIPAFCAENAWSSPWGTDPTDPTATCTRCGGEGEIYFDEPPYARKCAQCGGTGQVDLRVRGYSCCESALQLVRYFEHRGGCDDNTPVVIFHGRQVGAGSDNEPLVVPEGRARWTTYGKLKAHIERRYISYARISR